MPYPVFSAKSIIERCGADLDQFNTGSATSPAYKVSNIAEYKAMIKSADTDKTFSGFSGILAPVIQKINGYTKVELKTFDYPHKIASFDAETQKHLWCLRTVLFYQLLIFVTHMMSDQSVFTNVYTGRSYTRTFLPQINAAELEKYKMGIFGSLTPTSDIDVGIHYIGGTVNNGLAYIVAVIEDLFIIFTGLNSLQWDIELYADLFTIVDSATGNYLFYLDTTDFTKEDFSVILPAIESSILRNYYTGVRDAAHNSALSIAEIKSTKPFSFDQFNSAIKMYFPDLFGKISQYLPENAFKTMSSQAVTIVERYLDSSYDAAREIYYAGVKTAEAKVFEISKRYNMDKASFSMTKPEIAETIVLLSDALSNRAESYNCAPTIAHVVRVLQATKDNPDKYKTITPEYCLQNKETDPFCIIGIYGFLTSIYEQLGYIYRFHLTYCTPKKLAKCDKKLDKYSIRVTDAVEHIGTIAKSQLKPSPAHTSVSPEYGIDFTVHDVNDQENPLPSQGGKRRKTKRNKKQKSKTRKLINRLSKIFRYKKTQKKR